MIVRGERHLRDLRFLLAGALAGFSIFPACRSATPAVETRFADPPAWAVDAVWYQIFPERFSNGDPANDPRPSDLAGSWPHVVPPGWQISDWGGDWYERQTWERGPGDFSTSAGTRRYGGDLLGIIQKLDYLKDLGITALYLNPIFESPSLHKYDASFYHHIDDNFGPDPERDRALMGSEAPGDPSTWRWTSADSLFLELIREAHRRDMRIIIDGVFNHCGLTFWAFQDVRRRGRESAYQDWFTVTSFDDPATPGDEFAYECWYGVPELPEFREDARGLVRGPREHIRAVVRRWMDPNGDGDPSDGIDGWRLDVAEKVHPEFWRDFRRWVREINPDAYLAGEVWWEDWGNERMFNAAPWLQGDVFDAVMNYRWARESFRFFAGGRDAIPPAEFTRRLEDLLADYPARNNFVLMNLYDSHDTDRLLSHIVNAGLPYDKHVGAQNPRYDVRKPTADERSLGMLMALFQMTYLGAPMVYYGTETGMWGADDPDCRKPMLWPEILFKPERAHPRGLSRTPDSNEPDTALFSWYRRLMGLRNGEPVLRRGNVEFLPLTDAPDLMAFRRFETSQSLWVVLNRGKAALSVPVEIGQAAGASVLKDLISGTTYTLEKGVCHLTIPARGGVILKGERL